MAQQNINIGTSANKGDGDPIRTAFTKVNANFTELFATHDGSIAQKADIQGSVFADDSTVLVDAVSSKINLDGTVKGNIIPDTNVAYDIGSSSLRFKDLYLSGNTIHLGTSSLSVDANGNFSFSGGLKSNNPIVGDDSTLLVDTANSTIPFTVLSDKPTTLSGYGITDGGGTTFTGTTDGITEGSTNLFFTDARVTTKLGSVSSDILPDTNVAYDIGSSSLRFKDLYLSGTTIHIGESQLSVDDDGNFDFSGSIKAQPILGDDSTLLVDTTNSKLILTNNTTADLEEDTNLYFTDARADSRAQLKIDSVIASAPGALDTLNELAAALGDDANFSTTVTNSIAAKEPTITAGTSVQYYRGDKTFQTLNTTAVAEGTNLYYTNARADARITAANTDDLSEGVTYLYYTNTRADARIALTGLTTLTDVDAVVAGDDGKILYYDHATTSFKWKEDATGGGGGPADTDALEEGVTNLYYTNARADARIGLANLFDLTDVASVVAGDDNKVLFYEHSSTSFKWKVDADTTYTVGDGGLTQNNLTNTLKTNYDTAYTHSQAAHAPVGAEANEFSFKTITIAGQSDVIADTTIDTLSLIDGNNIAMTTAGDAIQISATGLIVEPGSSAQGDILYHNGSLFTRLAKPGTPADEVLTFAAGATAPSWIVPSEGGETNESSFKTIAIDGQSDGVADTTTDTLSFEAGSNMTITTNATTDTVTFTAAGGGGGGGGDLRNYLIDGDFTQWMEHTSIVLGEEGDQKFTSTLMRYEKTGDVEYTASRSTDVPTAAQAGHQSAYSLKMLNSGDNSGTVGVSDYSRLTYTITGSDYASLHGGQDLMLSFWVKSSMTGTYVVGFRNGQAPPERAMPMEYTISAANTWEKKNIAFTTDAAGTWYFDEINAGLKIHWGLLSGDDFDGTAETWGGDGYLWATSNQVNHGATQGGTFYLSQIALYKTDTAPASYLGDPIPLVKDKVGYYYRKSYRDFDNPGTATNIGAVRSEGEYDTSLGGVSNPRTTSVTFGSRMRNLGDGEQPLIRLFDVAGTEEKITLLDMGEESHGQTGDYIYHCESGFQVKTDDETARNGMTFQYTIDVRHIGDSGGMF